MIIENVKNLREQGKSSDEILSELNAPTIEKFRESPVGMGECLSAFAEAGIDGDRILSAFAESGAIGSAGVVKWATDGLDFSHPITRALMSALVDAGAITQLEMDLLVGLSSWFVSPWRDQGHDREMVQADLDAIDAELASQNQPSDETKHEVLLSANRSAGGAIRVVARITEVHFLDGQMLRRGETRFIKRDDWSEVQGFLSEFIDG